MKQRSDDAVIAADSREAVKRSARLLDSLPEPLLVVRPDDFAIVFANTAFYEQFEIHPHDAEVERPFDDAGRPIDYRLLEVNPSFEQQPGAHAVRELRESRRRLAAELAAMDRLHELVIRLLATPDLETALDEVLDATLEISGAAMGNVQLLSPSSGALEIVAERGFDQAFLARFATVGGEDSTACGRALRSRQRCIVEDVEVDPDFEPYRDAAAAAGFRGVQSTPLTSRDGEILGVLSTHFAKPYHPSERDLRMLDLYTRQAADLIERKRAEEALRASEAQLRQENKNKDAYLAMLGHELRNPLGAIRAAAELLKRSKTDDARMLRAFAVLERQSVHMSRIIDGLLDVSRIARGKIHLELQRLDACEVARRATEGHASRLPARGLDLRFEPASGPLWVTGDEARLAQIVDNLLGNAVKFTPPPGTITVTVRRDAHATLIRVCDTGVGIRPEMLERIFEPFQQEAQDVARTAGGLGLGLALAKGLVELHDGTIEAHSEGAGTGAVFEVRLPLAPGPAEEVKCEGEAPEPRGRQLLLVEDHGDAARMLRDLLESAGHYVAIATTGTEALEALRRRPIDVVLCDLGLPGMSGYELVSAIRSDPALTDVPVVALSGYGQPEDRRKTAQLGFDGHLLKPVDLATLRAVLRRLGRPRA